MPVATVLSLSPFLADSCLASTQSTPVVIERLILTLIVEADGEISGYKLRQQDQKTKAVKALQGLNLQVISAGDSYNDTGMLQQADAGILFCPPENVIREFPQFPVATDYDQFKELFLQTREALLKGH